MAGEMDKTTIIVLGVVGSLGLLSTILGFSAEGTKLASSDVLVGDGVCYYPHNPAWALGVCAAIFLIIVQVIVAVVSGCCESLSLPSETNRIIALVCAVFSWIAAAIALALLVEGAASNAEGPREIDTFRLCYFLKDGIFAGAAVLTLAATALGLTSFVLLSRQPDSAATSKTGAALITMGHPQFPQQPPPQGYRQAPPPNYPQYSPPPQGYGQFAPPPAQGYGAHAPNQECPPSSAQSYAPAHAPNQQVPPPQGHDQV
ncbi:unnamed protein product [Alopecurus aequalis]